MKHAYFDSGPNNKSAQRASCLREKGKRHTYHESLLLSGERFQYLRVRQFLLRRLEGSWTQIVALRLVGRILVLKNAMISCPSTRRGFSPHLCKVRLIPYTSGCTNICVASSKRGKTERMSVMTVFGGRSQMGMLGSTTLKAVRHYGLSRSRLAAMHRVSQPRRPKIRFRRCCGQGRVVPVAFDDL